MKIKLKCKTQVLREEKERYPSIHCTDELLDYLPERIFGKIYKVIEEHPYTYTIHTRAGFNWSVNKNFVKEVIV